MSENGGPAFPGKYPPFLGNHGGIAIRDLMALVAMHAIWTTPKTVHTGEAIITTDEVANLCYMQADAMLAAREKK